MEWRLLSSGFSHLACRHAGMQACIEVSLLAMFVDCTKCIGASVAVGYNIANKACRHAGMQAG